MEIFGQPTAPLFEPITISANLLNDALIASVALAAAPAIRNFSEFVDRGPAVIAPWDILAVQQSEEEIQRTLLSRNPLINLDDPSLASAQGNETFEKMFALYKGLDRIENLIDYAQKDSTPAGQLISLNHRFQSMLGEIFDFVDNTTFPDLTLLSGVKSDKFESEGERLIASSDFTGNIAHTGARTDVIAGLTGTETFTVSVKRTSDTVDVVMDLSEMGATPLTMDDITAYMNGKMSAAGLITTFNTERFTSTTFGFTVKGFSSEVVTMTAPVTEPSLYVTTRGGAGATSSGILTKINSLGSADPVQEFRNDIRDNDTGVTAQDVAVDSQGNVYMVGGVEDDFGTQILKGEKDLYLLKYDQAGNEIFRRLLGANSSAEGFAVAVDSADNVIVAGRAEGDLTDIAHGGGIDSFVTKFSSSGAEIFTRQAAPVSNDAAFGITLDASDNIYIGGYTNGALDGTITHGGSADGYVTGLDADGALLFNKQFGGTGSELTRDVAIANDGNLLVLSEEDGRAVLSKYDIANPNDPALFSVDLGDLAGGALGGLAVDANGVYVTGSAGADNITGAPGAGEGAYSGGNDGFVTRIDDSSGVVTWTRYVGTTDSDKVGAVTVSGGDVYVTGSTTGIFAGEARTGTTDAFVAKLDSTGVRQWTHQYGGGFNSGVGTGVAVDPAGTSVLSQLGLPSGLVKQTVASAVVDETTVRAGDTFRISLDGARDKIIKIDSDDTFADLATRINFVLGLDGKAEVKTRTDITLDVNGEEVETDLDTQYLRITAYEGHRVELKGGLGGFDALAGLGLQAGSIFGTSLVSTEDPSDDATTDIVFGLGLTNTLTMATKADLESTSNAISAAISSLKSAFRALEDTGPESLSDRIANAGPPPEFLSREIANYQAALARLTGGG